jgi:hypothetical protein
VKMWNFHSKLGYVVAGSYQNCKKNNSKNPLKCSLTFSHTFSLLIISPTQFSGFQTTNFLLKLFLHLRHVSMHGYWISYGAKHF